LVARFLPGLSTVTVPLAGASGVPMGRFYGFAALGAALWIATGLALGYFLAPEIAAVLLFLRRIGLDAAAVAVLLTAFYILYRLFRRRQLIRQLRMARIDIVQLLEMIDGGLRPAIVDVRSAWQREQDPHIIPGGLLWEEISKGQGVSSLAKTDPVVIYCICPNEASAALIARQLHKLGYHDVRPLRGGLAAWRQAGQPTQPLALPAQAAPRRNNLIPQLS
jgi:rhodanese-related sulfurtransferase